MAPPTETVQKPGPTSSEEGKAIDTLVRLARGLEYSARSISVQMGQMRKEIRDAIEANPKVAELMAQNKALQKFIAEKGKQDAV